MPPRQVLAGIFFVLRTGIQWKALPKEYGAASSVHEYFSKWAKAKLFMRLWQEGTLLTGGKKGTRRSLIVESHGLPIGIVLSGANTHDIKLLEGTLQSIITAHPEGSNICLDAGYVGARTVAEAMGYVAYIRGRGEEKQEKERKAGFKARRWVVEVCHSWLNRFRKLLIRYEKKDVNYLALLQFACAIIVWRQIVPVHPGLIPG